MGNKQEEEEEEEEEEEGEEEEEEEKKEEPHFVKGRGEEGCNFERGRQSQAWIVISFNL